MKNILALMLLLITFFSCEKEIEYNTPTEKFDEGITVNTNPMLMTLNNSSLNNTNGPGMNYATTGEIRVLNESLPEGFKEGIDTSSVLAVDLDTSGLLRKVSSFGMEGEEFVMKTEQAVMGDVFLDAEFTLTTEEFEGPKLKSGMSNKEISRALTDEQGRIHPVRVTYFFPEGIYTKSALLGDQFNSTEFLFEYNDTLVNKEHVKIWLDAYLKAYSKFILKFNYQNGYIERIGMFKYRYHRGELKYFGAYYNGGVETFAQINMLTNYETEYEKVKKIKNDLFKISYKFFVAFVPVFINVSCDIYGRVTCSFEGEAMATSGISTQADLKLGVEYKNGHLSPINEFESERQFNPLTIEGAVSATARTEIYPKFMVSIYGAGGPTIDMVPYLGADINASASYTLAENSVDAGWDASLYFGVDARIGAVLEILGHNLAEYNSGNIEIIEPYDIWNVPNSIEMVSGNQQSDSANKKLSDPIEVLVRDSWNSPFPFIPVVYSLPEQNGTTDKAMTLTNFSGKAENYWTLGESGNNSCVAKIKKADGEIIDSVVFTAVSLK